MIKDHYSAIFLAIIVLIISASQGLLASQALGSSFHGVPFLFQDAETVYLSRIHEIVDGHGSIASPVFNEYKESASFIPPVGEWVYVAISKVTQTSIYSVVNTSKYIFPAILFLLIYAFVFMLLKGDNGPLGRDVKLVALASASTVILGYDLIDIRTVLSLFSLKELPFHAPIWTRLVNPITGGIFLFSFLIALWKTINKEGKFAPYLASIFLAFSVGYIFSFGLALSTMGTLLIATFIQKNWLIFKKLIFIVFGALILSLPHIIPILSSVKLDVGTGLRSGLFMTHVPILNIVLLIALGMMLVGIVYERSKKAFLTHISPQFFFFLVLIGAFLAMNQQVITGRTVWPQHFVQYTIPLSIIAFFIVTFIYLRQLFPRAWRVIPIFLILISFSFSIVMIPTYERNLEAYNTANRYTAAFSWLDNSTKNNECVVLPVENLHGMMNYSITAFTHCDVYLSLYTFSGVPMDRVKHNFFVYLAFQGVTNDLVGEYLQTHRHDVQIVFFRDWGDLFYGNNDRWLRSVGKSSEIDTWIDQTIQNLAGEYREFTKKNLKQELLAYRLDYLIIDRNENPNWSSPIPIKEVFHENDVSVYTIQ